MSRCASLFSQRLRGFMASAGIGPQEVADRIGIARSAVQRWLAGQGAPSLDAIEKIAALMGITVSSLLDAEEPPTPPRVPPDILEALERCNETELAAVRAVLGGFKRGWDALAASRQEGEQLAHHRKRKA